MPELITLGETMAAFAPLTFPQAPPDSYRMRTAGAESNTAIGLSRLGHSALWISRLGADPFGYGIREAVSREGVDISAVKMDGSHRTGVMFKAPLPGAETVVTYYRDRSAASFLSPEDLSESDFRGAKILHITGITPLLSDSCYETVRAAIRLARKYGLLVSFDPNIRKKLWEGRNPAAMIRELLEQSDIALLGVPEGKLLYGCEEPDALFDRILSGGCVRFAALKDGGKGAWAADSKERHFLPPLPCRCMEPVGAGDGFNAGFLHGILNGLPVEVCGKMGGICGALATESLGDVEGYPSLKTLDQILAQGRDSVQP